MNFKIKVSVVLIAVFAMMASLFSFVNVSANSKEFPEYEFVKHPYENLDEAGLDIESIKDFFPETIEVKYENGKYMAKDIGANEAHLFSYYDYTYKEMTYEAGYWVLDVSEEIYNDEDVDFEVYFYNYDYLWYLSYKNGERSDYVQISDAGNVHVIFIYYNQDVIECSYPVGDNFYTDVYENKKLVTQEARYYFENDFVSVYYDSLKNVDFVKVYSDGYYYYKEDFGWCSFSNFDESYRCEAPSDYADKDLGYFVSLAPCTIGCTHEESSDADCVNPSACILCGLIQEEALGHDIVIDEAVEATCTETGLTEGSHCSRCDDETIAQEVVYELGHDIVTLEAIDATCTETGLTEGSYCTRCDDATVNQEEVDMLGHDIVIDEAVDATCTETGLTEGSHCSRCDEATTAQEVTAKLEHNYSEEYKSNSEGHWKECSCGSKTENEDHKGGSATETTKAICEVCQTEYGSLKEAAETPSEQTDEPEKEQGCGGSVAASILGLLTLSGAVVFLRKKRN